MPSHELLYFNGAGRAEVTRIMLHIAKADWKDTRFEYEEWHSTIQSTTPLGSVPVLKIDGVSHTQSAAMMRYAGKLAGWYPTADPLEALIVDEFVDCFSELMSKAPRSDDPEEMKKVREEFQATTMMSYTRHTEEAIQRNGGCGLTSKLSIADVALSGVVAGIETGIWDHLDPHFFDQFPGIVATVKAVNSNEQVKSYYESLDNE